MRIEFYHPERLYGFAEEGETRVFFHLGTFAAGRWPGLPLAPPPILGEEVLVDFTPSPGTDRPPKAAAVNRVAAPVALRGVVESFNSKTGWGFIRAGAESYYLHRSEVEGGRLPLPGQQVEFFCGQKRGRPRACHVRVGRLAG